MTSTGHDQDLDNEAQEILDELQGLSDDSSISLYFKTKDEALGIERSLLHLATQRDMEVQVRFQENAADVVYGAEYGVVNHRGGWRIFVHDLTFKKKTQQ